MSCAPSIILRHIFAINQPKIDSFLTPIFWFQKMFLDGLTKLKYSNGCQWNRHVDIVVILKGVTHKFS